MTSLALPIQEQEPKVKLSRILMREAASILFDVVSLSLGTLLMVLGLYVVFFLMLGSFALDGFMAHLGRLTEAYAVADESSRSNWWKLNGFIAFLSFLIIAGCRLILRNRGTKYD